MKLEYHAASATEVLIKIKRILEACIVGVVVADAEDEINKEKKRKSKPLSNRGAVGQN